MTTTPSAAVAIVQPAFTESERFALAGFLAGYRGLTRQAYTLAAVHRLVPRPLRALVLGPPRRHRDLPPRARRPAPRSRQRHPAALHHRRVLRARGPSRP